MRKSDDPAYEWVRQRYLKAVNKIHDLEVEQHTNRLYQMAAVGEEKKPFRRAMYSARKQLASLNKDIAAYYRYREAHHFSPWE